MARNQNGVTLLELMVAMVLMAIALVGLAASFPYAMTAVTGGGFQTTATLLAQECIELAKALPYEQLPVDLAPNCPGAPPNYSGFTRSVTVAPASPTATATTVTVGVTYQSPQGPVSTTVATIIAR